MKHLLALLALAMLAFTQPANAYELPKAKLMAVYFYADWCPNCKLLTPQLEKARAEGALDTKPILFVKLNLTDTATIRQSSMLAQALGISAFVQAQGSATGYVALLDATTKTEITRFDRATTSADILKGIEKALETATPKQAVKP